MPTKTPVPKKTSANSAKNKAFDFEASLEQLETLVSRMETGELSLEESLKAFEEGVILTRLCQETLTAAQQKVQMLMQQQGKITLESSSFSSDEDMDDDIEDDQT